MSKSTLALINEIKTENQDFEFYPTTTDMLQCIEKNIKSREVHGLSNSATNFINDICTVAFNIGYDTEGMQRAEDFKWESNKKKLFMFKNHSSGETEELFEVKAFKNGNLHIKLRPSFICKLNVEFGRLKGWLKTKEEASSELGMGIEEVNGAFKSNFQIPTSSALRLIAA